MIKGLENVTREEKLRELDTFSLQKRRPEGDIQLFYSYIKGYYKEGGDQLFSLVNGDKTRSNRLTWEQGRFR